MIKGIIFDFDGLIFDTETHQYLLLKDLYTEHGFDLPIERWQQEIGTQSGFSPIGYLSEKAKIEYNVLNEKFIEKYHSILSTEKARDGVEDYLRYAKEMDLKIGLATSSTYDWVAKHLKSLNLLDYFECIRTSDDVEKVKPDPALYLQTGECLGLSAAECLVFEDSANGALAAKRAGMNCVIVPNEVTATMNFCTVEHRLQSMAEMPLQDVIDYVKKISLSR